MATHIDKWSDEDGSRIHSSADPHSVDEPVWRVGHGANEQRIEWLLTGDNTDTDTPTQVKFERYLDAPQPQMRKAKHNLGSTLAS